MVDNKMRVAIADDDEQFRAALALQLQNGDFYLSAQVGTGREIMARVDADPPDVVILDIGMPFDPDGESGNSGLHVADELRLRYPGIAILVLSGCAKASYANRLFRHGPNGIGYITKRRLDPSTLRGALKRVAADQWATDETILSTLMSGRGPDSAAPGFSKRGMQVLRLMAGGQTNEQIAQELQLPSRTIEKYLGWVFDCLNSEDTAASWAPLPSDPWE